MEFYKAISCSMVLRVSLTFFANMKLDTSNVTSLCLKGNLYAQASSSELNSTSAIIELVNWPQLKRRYFENVARRYGKSMSHL